MKNHHAPRLAAFALATLSCLGAHAQTTSRAVDEGEGSSAIAESYESASANRAVRAIVSATGKVSIVENKIRAPRGRFDRTLSTGCATETSTPIGAELHQIIRGFEVSMPSYKFEREPIDCSKANNPVGSLGSIFDQEIWVRGTKTPYVSSISTLKASAFDGPPSMAQVEAFSKLPNRVYAVNIAGSKLLLGSASEREAAKFVAERGAFHAPKSSDASFAVETHGKTLRQGEKDFDQWIASKYPEAAKPGYAAPDRSNNEQAITIDVNVAVAFEGARLLKFKEGACALENSRIIAWSVFETDNALRAKISAPRATTRRMAVSCEPHESGTPCEAKEGGLFGWVKGTPYTLSCEEGFWRPNSPF